MGRCWTPRQRTSVHYNAGETRAAGERLGVAHSEVGTVCASCASTGLCGGAAGNSCPYRDKSSNQGADGVLSSGTQQREVR